MSRPARQFVAHIALQVAARSKMPKMRYLKDKQLSDLVALGMLTLEDKAKFQQLAKETDAELSKLRCVSTNRIKPSTHQPGARRRRSRAPSFRPPLAEHGCACASVCLSVGLSVGRFVCLSVCLSVCLCLSICAHTIRAVGVAHRSNQFASNKSDVVADIVKLVTAVDLSIPEVSPRDRMDEWMGAWDARGACRSRSRLVLQTAGSSRRRLSARATSASNYSVVVAHLTNTDPLSVDSALAGCGPRRRGGNRRSGAAARPRSNAFPVAGRCPKTRKSKAKAMGV
jgi:hypothetical protein